MQNLLTKLLINKTKFLNDADFIIRLLYKHSYYCCNHCSLYSNLYTLRAFYIIAMISDSYYLIPILGLLCFYVWLGLSTFNEHDDDCMHIVKISILTP